MSNIYYHPEEYGLTQVAIIDYSDGCYCFDFRVVWRHDESGKLYTARNSGCSCPSPFEDFMMADLEDFSFSYLKAEAQDAARDENYRGDSVSDFINQIQNLQ